MVGYFRGKASQPHEPKYRTAKRPEKTGFPWDDSLNSQEFAPHHAKPREPREALPIDTALPRRCHLPPLARSVNSSPSALTVGIVGCRMAGHFPVRHGIRTLPRLLRATVLPQRWPACRGKGRGLCIDSDVLQNLVDVCTERDENEVSAKTNFYSSYVAAKAMMHMGPL